MYAQQGGITSNTMINETSLHYDRHQSIESDIHPRLQTRKKVNSNQQSRQFYESNIFHQVPRNNISPSIAQTPFSPRSPGEPRERHKSIELDGRILQQSLKHHQQSQQLYQSVLLGKSQEPRDGTLNNQLYNSRFIQHPPIKESLVNLEFRVTDDIDQEMLVKKLKNQGVQVVKLEVPYSILGGQTKKQEMGKISIRIEENTQNLDDIRKQIENYGLKTSPEHVNNNLKCLKKDNKWIHQHQVYQKIGFLSNRDDHKPNSERSEQPKQSIDQFRTPTKSFTSNSYFSIHGKTKEILNKISSPKPLPCFLKKQCFKK